MSKGGLARRAAVAAAEAGGGAKRRRRPEQRQRRPRVPTHICSQRPVFTESHFTQPKQSNLSAKTNLLSQRKPLYAYDMTFLVQLRSI